MPLFDSQLQQLMTNNIIGRNSHLQTNPNKSIRSNPSLLLTKSSRQSSHLQPIFSNSSYNQQQKNVFEKIYGDRRFDFNSTQYQSSYQVGQDQESRSDKQRSLLYTHKFIKFSSYFRDQYDINDHNGEFEEVQIGGEIYKFKKPKVNARRRNRYKPLAPAPKRLPVSRTVGDGMSMGLMGESRVYQGQQSLVNKQSILNFEVQQQSVVSQDQFSLLESSVIDNNININDKLSPLPINTIAINNFTSEGYNKLITSQIGNEQIQSQSSKLTRQRPIYSNKGIQYDKYCLQTTNPRQLDKYYNRIITYPKLKAKLSPQLQRIKNQLKKKFPAVYANEDTSSSQQQSSSDQQQNEQTRKRKKGEREWKKEQLRRKRERKEYCQIVGQKKVGETHRWGSKQQYDMYIKKKEYEDKIKRINQEKMRKFNIGKRVEKKLTMNKYKDNLIRLLFGADGVVVDEKPDHSNRQQRVIQLLDDDDDANNAQVENSRIGETVVIGVDDNNDDSQLQGQNKPALEDDNDCVVVVASRSDCRKPHAIDYNRPTTTKIHPIKLISIIQQSSKPINLDSQQQQQLSTIHISQENLIRL